MKKMKSLIEQFKQEIDEWSEYKRSQKEALSVIRFHIANPELRTNMPACYLEEFIKMKDSEATIAARTADLLISLPSKAGNK